MGFDLYSIPPSDGWKEICRRAAIVCGGVPALAERIQVSRTSIYSWIQKGYEPRLQCDRQALLDVAEEYSGE